VGSVVTFDRYLDGSFYSYMARFRDPLETELESSISASERLMDDALQLERVSPASLLLTAWLRIPSYPSTRASCARHTSIQLHCLSCRALYPSHTLAQLGQRTRPTRPVCLSSPTDASESVSRQCRRLRVARTDRTSSASSSCIASDQSATTGLAVRCCERVLLVVPPPPDGSRV
jgi:hypothetical protein